jgi:exopolysaccharide biosynthesis predicted pyruvyltransferase EpsI
MSIVEFHRMDANNPGDWYCNPSRYFFPEQDTTKIDIDNVRKTSWHQHDTIIVGGGGLIGNPNFETLMKRITVHPDEQIFHDILEIKLKNISKENKIQVTKWREEVQKLTVNFFNRMDKTIGPRILWGAGLNSKDASVDSYDAEYPSWLNKFHLVGVRDWDTDYRWVPCASCMHPAFDKKYEIKNEIVWFEHKKRLIDNKWFDTVPAPRMLNTGQNIEQILEFLGSAETVVTNSYHGVYWATLLKRKVICIPWGSKFNMFKHPPVMANERTWSEKIGSGEIYEDALKDCRETNIAFFNDVTRFIQDYRVR